MTNASGKSRNDSSLVEILSIPKFTAKFWSDAHVHEFERAAKAYAARNQSDPFAYNRAMLHLQRGIMDVSEALGRAAES